MHVKVYCVFSPRLCSTNQYVRNRTVTARASAASSSYRPHLEINIDRTRRLSLHYSLGVPTALSEVIRSINPAPKSLDWLSLIASNYRSRHEGHREAQHWWRRSQNSIPAVIAQLVDVVDHFRALCWFVGFLDMEDQLALFIGASGGEYFVAFLRISPLIITHSTL